MKIPWPRYTVEVMQNVLPISDDFSVKLSPVIQKPAIQTNTATSIVACVNLW